MPRGGFGGRGGFGMRRGGYPLMTGGMGMGSPLLTDLMAGGLGYMLGSRNQNTAPQTAQPPAVQPPPYPPPYYAPAPAAPPVASTGGDNETLAQLKLLGQLHASGILTDEEFASEKQRILGGA